MKILLFAYKNIFFISLYSTINSLFNCKTYLQGNNNVYPLLQNIIDSLHTTFYGDSDSEDNDLYLNTPEAMKQKLSPFEFTLLPQG